MIQRILSLEKEFQTKISNSFLSEAEKSTFIELMSERMERLRGPID